jgi:hypothetical protein
MPFKTFRTGKIATQRATFTLEQLHAELAGKLHDSKREAARLIKAMKHVEAVLKLLQPGYNVATVAVRRRKPNPWFKRGTVLRHVLAVLRTAERPLSPREITVAMLRAQGVADPDEKEFYKLVKSVSSALISHGGKSLVRHDQSNPFRWSIQD